MHFLMRFGAVRYFEQPIANGCSLDRRGAIRNLGLCFDAAGDAAQKNIGHEKFSRPRTGKLRAGINFIE